MYFLSCEEIKTFFFVQFSADFTLRTHACSDAFLLKTETLLSVFTSRSHECIYASKLLEIVSRASSFENLSTWTARKSHLLEVHLCGLQKGDKKKKTAGRVRLCLIVLDLYRRATFPNSNSIWIIAKHFIMSLWRGILRKQSPCF